MPPRPEYWILNEKQFKQIKSQLDDIGQYAYTQLEPVGFTNLKSQPDWLGFTIEKKAGEQLTIVVFSLIKEKPIEFELAARQWQISNPSETCIEIYQKAFASIEEVITNRSMEFTALEERLENEL
jgi:hypothetical protein